MKNLKHAILTCLVIAIGLTSLAQETTDESANTEFNIGISNIFANPIWEAIYYDYYDSPDLLINPQKTSVVAGFKFHDRAGAFRLKTAVNYSNNTIEDSQNSDQKMKYNTFSSDLYVGYEGQARLERVTVFYGFDVMLGYQNAKTKEEGSMDNNSESSMNVVKFGIGPLAGVNYFLTPKLSLGTEFQINFMGYSGKSKSTYTAWNGMDYITNTSESKLKGFKTYFGPLGYLSFNIYF